MTTFRTELDYPRIVAYVAWFDHTRTALAFYPGRYEPPNAPVRGPMIGPLRPALAAARDLQRRLHLHRRSQRLDRQRPHERAAQGRPRDADRLPRRPRRHRRLERRPERRARTSPSPARACRRSSGHGRLNPALNDSSQWGFTLGNAVRVWRTGVGIDRRGNLIYAAADYQTVITLAQILQRAGAVRAMQFDINPEWPTLITYSHRHGLDPDEGRART